MWSREISKILRNKENIYGFSYTIVKGSVGTVSKYMNLRTMENVAIKIIRKKSDPMKEIKMAEALRELDPDETNIVRFIEHFKWKKYACLVFELLDQTLCDLLLSRGLCPLTLEEIRPVAHQVLTALDALHTIGVVHNDLKLDNIMLVKDETPYKVKLIDFGMAFRTSEADRYQGVEMQMLRLRAPEIILGHPVSEAVDLWSFGCILVQLLFRGPYPFQGHNEFEMLKHIVHVVGQPSDCVLDASQYANKFFVKSGHWDNPKWSLKRTNEYEEKESTTELRPRIINRLHDLLDFREVGENMDDARAFVNLLKCLLQTDPEQRITAGRALNHSFVTMKHLMKESSNYSGDSLNQRLDDEKETMTQLYHSPVSTPITSGPSNETGSSFDSTFSASSCETDEGPSAKSSDSCPTFIVDKPSVVSTTQSISRPLSLESSAGAPEAPSSYGTPKDTPSSYVTPKDTPSSSGSRKDTPSSAGTPEDTPSSYITPQDTISSSGSPKRTPSSTGTPEATSSSYGTPEDTPSSYCTPEDTPSSSGSPKDTPSSADKSEDTPSSAGPPEKKPCAAGAIEKMPSVAGAPMETLSTTGAPAEGSPVNPKKTCLQRICVFLGKDKNYLKRNNKVYAECMQVGP